MARVTYSSASVQGARLQEAIDHLIKGREALNRWYAAADQASNAGTVPGNLEGGDFGASAGQGDELWATAASVKNLLDGDDAGGLAGFLAALDTGSV